MDVLNPELKWIDGRCYRVPTINPAFLAGHSYDFTQNDRKNQEYDDDDDLLCDRQDSEVADCSLENIEELPNGRYQLIFPVARCFLPFIIGSKGATINRISKDTLCNVVVPKFSGPQNISILGPDKSKVILAWKTISFIIQSSRQKLKYTHFVSIPLTADCIKKNFLKFKEEVLSKSYRGIDESLFQCVDRIHLSAAVLVLTNDEERKQAEEIFLEICDDTVGSIFPGKKLKLHIKGLDYMNDDPSAVSVLYAKVANSDDFIQDLCDRFYKAFCDVGLAKTKKDGFDVKLHATLLNTKFLLEDEPEGINVPRRKKITFDATDLLRDFKDFDFGEQEFNSIHLSIGSSVDDETGYYKSSKVVRF